MGAMKEDEEYAQELQAKTPSLVKQKLKDLDDRKN